MKNILKIFLIIQPFLLLAPSVSAAAEDQKKNQFGNFEIRVIRPKYFQKSIRFEIGANVSAVMNSSFTYTYLPSAKAGLHLTEWLEVFGEGAAGITINKSDCTELGSKFNIEPVVDEIGMLAGGGINLTPIYGKYQLSNGEVIYFDWFLSGGGGVAGMKNRKQGCKPVAQNEVVIQPKAYSPAQFNVGTGQRYFLSKNSALNWGLRLFFIPGIEQGMNQSVTLSFGAGYYF